MISSEWFFWLNYFTEDDIRELNGLRDNHVKVASDTPALDPTKELKKVSLVTPVEWGVCAPLLSAIDEEVILTNRNNYGYHIDQNLLTNRVLFNDYCEADNYDWHQDGSNDKRFDYKFTVLINTSLESYEGGELQLFRQGGIKTVKELNTQGSVVMFRSDIPHRVTAITKGKRSSLVYWKEGPSFV